MSKRQLETELSPREQKRLLKKKRRKRKIILLIIEIIVLLIVLAALYVWQALNKIEKAPATSTELSASELNINEEELENETIEIMKGYEDVALFGVDNYFNGHADSGNSDVIMIASINNDTKEVKLVSVYRDTFLDTDVQRDSSPNFHKANRAFAIGGAEQSIRMLNASLDLDIEHFITVDFKVVTDVVNMLGGVDIDVSAAEMKEINRHIDTTAKATGDTPVYISAPGMQTLNGTQATTYARIRKTVGNDYARAGRQREVINEIVKKAKKTNLATINKIINQVFPEICTNYTNADIIRLAASMFDYELSDSTGFPFSKYAARLGGSKGDVVLCADLESNVQALHRYLYNDMSYVPSATVKNYSDQIRNSYGGSVEQGDKPEAVQGGEIESDDFETGNVAGTN
ncbi:MAG: LCP family protein [Lachnospiraceae bacterium]